LRKTEKDEKKKHFYIRNHRQAGTYFEQLRKPFHVLRYFPSLC